MRVPAPRLSQLAHLFSVNPSAAFGYKNMLASLRRHRDPFSSRSTLPCTSPSCNVDPKFDVATVPDDRTLVGSRRHSSHSDKADSISLSAMPEDGECVKFRCSSREPPTSSETRDPSVRLSIIYPLPSAENLLDHEPTPPATTIDSVAPPFCVPALTPPPTHYKRRRGRIISDEDYDPESDQASIRYVCVLSFLAVGQVVTTPRADQIPYPRVHCDSHSEP